MNVKENWNMRQLHCSLLTSAQPIRTLLAPATVLMPQQHLIQLQHHESIGSLHQAITAITAPQNKVLYPFFLL
jgi:hypothetical protein